MLIGYRGETLGHLLREQPAMSTTGYEEVTATAWRALHRQGTHAQISPALWWHAQLRNKDPDAYLRLVSSLVPRELILEREREPDVDYAELSNDEAATLINDERRRQLIGAAIRMA